MKKILASCLSLCFCLTTGCLHFSRGYSSSEKIDPHDTATPLHSPWERNVTSAQTEIYNDTTSKKIPLTFSVELDEDGLCGLTASNKEQLTEKIRESLEKTGMFYNIQLLQGYRRTDNYHISFNFSRSCSDDGTLTFVSCFWVYTLFLLPFGENYYLDGGATVYLRGEEIAVYGKTEEISCFYWLPCAIAWPVANGFLAWGNAEDKIINGLVNDFTKEHMERFANKE